MRFKSKKDNYKKYHCPQKTKVKFDESKIWLPKLLDVKARITQQFTGKIKTSTITKKPTGQYFVCALVETEETLPIPTTISKEENLGIEGIKANIKLAKAVSDVAWYQFTTLLKHKASWYGKNVIAIDRFEPSSKVCSCCGHKLQVLPLYIRKWECPACLFTHDRDINGAINIRNIATANALG